MTDRAAGFGRSQLQEADPVLLRTAMGTRAERVPVWLMRQAGRYLPEFRELEEQYGYWRMLSTPDLAARATLQPLERFPLDAALLASDVLVPLAAMNIEVAFTPGPVLRRTVRTASDVAALRLPEPGEVAPWVAETIRYVRDATDVPVIGLAGAPLILATYMVQGHARGEQALFRSWLHGEPHLAHTLMSMLATVISGHLREQVAAGASVIQLYDSWAGVFDLDTYREFGLPYVERILSDLGELGVPRIYLAVSGATHLYPLIASLPAEVISLDWRAPLSVCRTMLEGKVLQGNLDPAAMLTTQEDIEAKVIKVLQEGSDGPHIFNLGHSILPQTPVENVACLVDTVHKFQPGGVL